MVPPGNQQGRGSFEFFAVFRGLDQDVIGFNERLAVNPMIIYLPTVKYLRNKLGWLTNQLFETGIFPADILVVLTDEMCQIGEKR